MSTDPTELQGGQQRRRSREMSLKRGRPPTQVPGYEPERFLGVGAYGEVWVAVERNTGRRVAIKFYAHRGGLDWSLLSREVEKLAFLFADRYVVQLLAVGWDAEPPYYVMEYLERGSLAERLQQGRLPVDEAVATFHDVAVGLVHAHGKGVLHCDLKPANILLDQDDKPRLADFGQSRLSSEQAPALGTLFYMAPEQADLEAVPDARWDVYALGALLYCMLTGSPPHRTGELADEFEQTADLTERLSRYRRTIEGSPPPSAHRKVRGVDRQLAEIIDRCLAADPQQRYPNVQAVLDALRDRAARRARRPLMIVGAVGPALLLAVMSWFAFQWFRTTMQESAEALTARALDSNGFAAQYVARAAGNELERRFVAVEQVAESSHFCRLVKTFAEPDIRDLLMRLSDPQVTETEVERLRKQYREDPRRQKLQEEFVQLIPPAMKPRGDGDTSSWFFCEAHGVSTARIGKGDTIGWNLAYRSYFHGGLRDFPKSWRPEPGDHLRSTTLSAVFQSLATTRWVVAVGAPVFDDSTEKKEFLGVVALTVEVGKFVKLPGLEEQFAVLVDRRKGDNEGVILQHPLFDKILADPQQGKLPDRFNDADHRVGSDDLPDQKHPERQQDYHDPLAVDPAGGEYDQHWLARMEPVRVRGDDTGWIVIVQEAYDTAIGSTLDRLQSGLLHYGRLALAMIALVMAGLWWFAARLAVKH
jgi:hypothetical protein